MSLTSAFCNLKQKKGDSGESRWVASFSENTLSTSILFTAS